MEGKPIPKIARNKVQYLHFRHLKFLVIQLVVYEILIRKHRHVSFKLPTRFQHRPMKSRQEPGFVFAKQRRTCWFVLQGGWAQKTSFNRGEMETPVTRVSYNL